MIFEPNMMVFYVENLAISSQFYQDLLGLKPIEASVTFHDFTLSNGMSLALKARHSVVPPTEIKSGHGELAFTLDFHKKVDDLFVEWQSKGISMIFPPSHVPFGYTFVALDSDGCRLRVCCPGKQQA